MSEKTITVDVISDIACPWCYVGKKRLEQALEQWDGAKVVVKWHPYQLDPNMTKEGLQRDAYLVNKFGSIEKVNAMTNHLTTVGEEVGIAFDFGEKWMSTNTLHLHQLLHVAGKEGFQNDLKERFLKAYFVTLQPLNNKEVLYSLLADFGWSPEKVDAVIADQEIAQTVTQQIKHAQNIGVTGVPFFIINNSYAISGAQPSAVFLETFKKSQPSGVHPKGDSCDPVTGTC